MTWRGGASDSPNTSHKGGDLNLLGGAQTDALGGDGGDVIIDGGTSTNSDPGKVKIGNLASMDVKVVHKTDNYNATEDDFAIGMTSTYAVTLPASPDTGKTYFIYSISSSNDVTISNAGGDTFYYDGGSGSTMTLGPYEGVILFYDGTNWRSLTKYA